MGGVMGIAGALFGVFWTVMAIAGGAWFMAPFGLIFIGVAVFNAIYNFKNATGKNRYSQYDITDENEELDPWDERFGRNNTDKQTGSTVNGRYCPYCGTKNEDDYKYCTDCGRELP